MGGRTHVDHDCGDPVARLHSVKGALPGLPQEQGGGDSQSHADTAWPGGTST